MGQLSIFGVIILLAGVNFMRSFFSPSFYTIEWIYFMTKIKDKNKNFTRFFMVWWKLFWMKWNEFLDFSSVFWWNLLKMNTNGHSNRYMHNSDLSCWFQWNKQHIIQHLQRRFAIIYFFFFFEQAQLYEVKHFFFFEFYAHWTWAYESSDTQDKKKSSREINKFV